MPQLEDNSIRLHFVPFALKDLAKMWLYSLEANSITSWDDLFKAFLKKLYPIHKTALIQKNIMQFKQEITELFWKYFECFKHLLAQCPHHSLEKWWLWQIIYDGLDYQNKTFLETMKGDSWKKMNTKGDKYMKI